MNRKVNLAKLAKKGIEGVVKHGSVPDSQAIQPKDIKTESPYFSPISHRTRNKQLQKLPNKSIEPVDLKPVKVEIEEKVKNKEKVKTEKTAKTEEKVKTEKTAKTEERVKTEKNVKTEEKLKTEKSVKTDKKVSPRKHIKIEYEKSDEPSTSKSNDENLTSAIEASVGSKSKKRASDSAKAMKMEPVTDVAEKQPKWEPKNWQQMFDNIKTMRADRSAPVDTMGCDKCSDQNSPENIQRYHHLIALMLSSQTKDGVTFDAMNRLKDHGLTPQAMIDIKDADLETLLYPVSFYKTKTKHIKQTARILLDSYDSDIPKTITEMVKLPGVGPKMAHILMRVAWGIMTGIGVDTHVHRIANRLKWMKKETKTPEETRVALESWLPLKLWWEVNELLVGFGQNTCKPVHPLCAECLNYDICPSRQTKR